jgi:hypothetical protein
MFEEVESSKQGQREKPVGMGTWGLEIYIIISPLICFAHRLLGQDPSQWKRVKDLPR